jgi:hypothetical protein
MYNKIKQFLFKNKRMNIYGILCSENELLKIKQIYI